MPVDAARRGDETTRRRGERAPGATRSVRVRRFYSWRVPTPRLRAPCRAVLHATPRRAVPRLRGDEPRSVRAVRASPPARNRACVRVWRGRGAGSGRRKCACACDEIDGSVDRTTRRTTTLPLPLPLPRADEQKAEEAEEEETRSRRDHRDSARRRDGDGMTDRRCRSSTASRPGPTAGSCRARILSTPGRDRSTLGHASTRVTSHERRTPSPLPSLSISLSPLTIVTGKRRSTSPRRSRIPSG